MVSSESNAGTIESIEVVTSRDPAELSSSIANLVIEKMQCLIQTAIDQSFEKERGLLHELLAPMKDHLLSLMPEDKRCPPNLSDDDGSMDSDRRLGGVRGHRGRRARQASATVKREPIKSKSGDLRKKISQASSKGSLLLLPDPQDVQSLQEQLDGELLASACFKASRKRSTIAVSSHVSSHSPVGSWPPVEFKCEMANSPSPAANPSSPDASQLSCPVSTVHSPPPLLTDPPKQEPSQKQECPNDPVASDTDELNYGIPSESSYADCAADCASTPGKADADPSGSALPGQLDAMVPMFSNSSLFSTQQKQGPMTVETLRSEREAELTQNFRRTNSRRMTRCTTAPISVFGFETGSNEEEDISDDGVPVRGFGINVLRMCGLLPWILDCDDDENTTLRQQVANTLWQKVILCIAAASFGVCAWLTISLWRAASDDNCHICLQLSLLFDMFLSLGSAIGLLCISVVQHTSLLRAHALLLTYAQHHVFIGAWEAASCRALGYTCVFLVFVLLGRARVYYLAPELFVDAVGDLHAMLNFASSIFAIVLFMMLEFYILHVCSALALMVDRFSVEFVQHQRFPVAIREWNLIQATLRKVCCAVQWPFLVLQVTAMVVVTTSLMAAVQSNSFDAPALFPGTLVAFSVTQVFFRATIVTEKCERLTRFINSLTFSSKDIDRERQYVVEYINNSGAGFYFFNVRLTSQMAIKITYMSGLAVFFTATKAVSVL